MLRFSSINYLRNSCHLSILQTTMKYSSVANSDQVRTAKSLNTKDLQDLFSKKIMALRIPNFCPPEVVNSGLYNLRNKEIVEYQNAEGVGKLKDVGMAFFEIENEETRKKYYDERLSSLEALRTAFSPFLSPIDKVRVQLDEQWPAGASLLDLGKGPMFVGLVRAIQGHIKPHEDKLERDDPTAMSKIDYVSQIAFNCYLQVPDHGGELEIWDLSLNDNNYNELRGDSYGIDRSKLPSPTYTLKPEAGEFIAFNGRNLHAVTETKTIRVATSGFVLYQGEKKPLKFWS